MVKKIVCNEKILNEKRGVIKHTGKRRIVISGEFNTLTKILPNFRVKISNKKAIRNNLPYRFLFYV